MSDTTKYILVTGTNGGLGFGICTRLIDDFLRTHPASTSLTLIFTTRNAKKGADTLQSLRAHLSRSHPSSSHGRIRLRAENVELTSLLSVRTLCDKLVASRDIPYLNAVILNAGIGGWSGLNWLQAVVDVLSDVVTHTTWPRFKLGIAGLIVDKQFPNGDDNSGSQTHQSDRSPDHVNRTEGGEKEKEPKEPPLGQVFCANVFGHYVLVHWLMPLLRACPAVGPGRIIWVGSIEPRTVHFKEDDIMGLDTTAPYESSKRLTDILALTANADTARSAVEQFMAVTPDDHLTRHDGSSEDTSARVVREILSTPTMHLSHPGICTTSIVSLYWIVHQAYVAVIYFARWVGSPWAVVSIYLAAVSFTWLALAPIDEIRARERQYSGNKDKVGVKDRGNVKWGSSVNRRGHESIRPTDVPGWGISGDGQPFAQTWWAGRYGRITGAKDATPDEVDDFVALGGRVWRDMERLRVEWERRLETFEKTTKEKGKIERG